jgi:hypothetical protein
VAIIVVGGSGKSVGKTALVCGLLASLPEFHWTAVKVTRHQHSERAPSMRRFSGARMGNHDSLQPHVFQNPIWEETVPGQATDTARYLAAGAHRALLVASEDLSFPLDDLSAALGPGANLIFESNTIAAQLEPDLCLGVIGSGGPDMEIKPSFQPFMRRMDAAVVRPAENSFFRQTYPASPLFELENFEQLSPEVLTWVRGKLNPAFGSRAGTQLTPAP